MKFSLNWLREFVELPASVDELSQLLTLAGVEIEGVEHRGAEVANVVVGLINASSQHPNADRLSVCDVDDGTNHHRQIVCGAKNFKVGDKVPVALPGAALPNRLKIKASKLRGIESQGMLCSPSELKLSEDSDGLLILPTDAQVGAPLGTLYPADTILDVEITPNRGDLLSHFGLAREISALRGRAVKELAIEEDSCKAGDAVQVTASRECPFYSARRIENVTVAPSPAWLRAKIEAVGLRSINNIVDITNFVMLELGQPLHAFDADKLHGGINVRLAAAGEKFLALDGKEHTLTERDLMIADTERAVAIGGVMGGEDSGVTESTRNVLLEAAYFLPSSIRRTARTLNLPSDASYRFERGVDPAMTLRASFRAVQLIREIAGGEPSPETFCAGELPVVSREITFRHERCTRLLGLEIPAPKVTDILQGFGLENTGSGSWKTPSHRPDLQREIDLIEEVIRAYGIDKIPSSSRSRFTSQSAADRVADSLGELRQRLVALGISEARTSALIPRAAAMQEGAVPLRNPMSEDHVALRPNVVRGLLEVLARNLNQGATSVRLFEVGNIFLPPDATEKRALGLVLSGATASRSHWRTGGKRHLDFFDLKGALAALRIPNLEFRRAENAGLALAVDILSGGKVIGLMGQLSAARASEIGADAPVFVAQVLLEFIIADTSSGPQFTEIDRYPAVTRDIAMIAPDALSHDEILRAIRAGNEPLLAEVSLFDLFSGKGAESLGVGRKSMAYTLTYRDKNRTLTNDEINVIHSRIRGRIQRELAVELRE